MAKDNDSGEEIKDPLEVMDEADDGDETDPDKLIKSGMHIEGEDEAEIESDALGVTALEDNLSAFDPLLADDTLKLGDEEEVDGEVDLVDPEFEDDKDNW